MNERMLIPLTLLLLLLTMPANGQTADLPDPATCCEILFSISPPANVSYAWPPFKDGDLASNWGYVLARNWQLVQPFGPPPTFAPVDYGLDALAELRCYPAAVTFRPAVLFSVKKGFHSSRLNTDISDGDLLSVSRGLLDSAVDLANLPCAIVARNRDLVGRFGMMPPVQDMGLDAVFIPYYVPTADSLLPPEIWFSTNRGWWDEKLGRQISDGDLLSSRGYVVASNAQLLRNFFPNHTTPPPLGLDAVYVPRHRPWCNSPLPPEIWFSVAKGYDYEDTTTGERLHVSEGDLLSTTGKVIRTNRQLLEKFPNLTDQILLPSYGLDAVTIRGRNLIGSYPAGSTVSKVAGNVIRLVFDGAVRMPETPGLSVGLWPQGSADSIELAGSMFDVSLASTTVPDDTLVLTERGTALGDLGTCSIKPTDAINVEPFTFTVTRLVGDAGGDGVVNVGDLQTLVAAWGKSSTESDAAFSADFSADGCVNVGDLQLLVSAWGRCLQ